MTLQDKITINLSKKDNKNHSISSGNADSKSFRIRSCRFFLTYPNIDSSLSNIKEDALSSFCSIFKKHKDDFSYLICQEVHKSGSNHLHCYLEFKSPQGIYSHDALSIRLSNKIYCGNYESVRKKDKAIQYCLKDCDLETGTIISNMVLPFYKNQLYTSFHQHLQAVLDNDGEEQAKIMLSKVYPDVILKSGKSLMSNISVYMKIKNTIRDNELIKSRYKLDDFKLTSAAAKTISD